MSSVFFPQTILDILAAIERVHVEGEQIVLTREGYRYAVEEGVRVVEEVTTGEDPRDLLGRVVSNEQLTLEHGAEILGSSMLIEDSAYDVVPGMIGRPADEAAAADAEPERDALAELASLEEVQEALA